MSTIRTLCLEKDGHAYLFRYELGSEDEVVEEVMRMADDRTNNFDWMDAATLSFHLTENATDEARKALAPGEFPLE